MLQKNIKEKNGDVTCVVERPSGLDVLVIWSVIFLLFEKPPKTWNRIWPSKHWTHEDYIII